MAHFSIASAQQKAKESNTALFNFLTDFSNFKSILPEDKTDGFSYDDTSCSFNIKGITPMKVVLDEKLPFEKIRFNSQGLGKFNFNLEVFFKGAADEVGECKIELSGDMNPFIVSMAEKSLTALVNSMNQKLTDLKLS